MSSQESISAHPLLTASILGLTNWRLFECTLGTVFRKSAWAISQYGPYPLLLCVAGAHLRSRSVYLKSTLATSPDLAVVVCFYTFGDCSNRRAPLHGLHMEWHWDINVSDGCGPRPFSHVVDIGGVFALPMLFAAAVKAWILRHFFAALVANHHSSMSVTDQRPVACSINGDHPPGCPTDSGRAIWRFEPATNGQVGLPNFLKGTSSRKTRLRLPPSQFWCSPPAQTATISFWHPTSSLWSTAPTLRGDRISSELAANGLDVHNSRAINIAAVQSSILPYRLKTVSPFMRFASTTPAAQFGEG